MEGKREKALEIIDFALLIGGRRLYSSCLHFIDIIEDEIDFLSSSPFSKLQKRSSSHSLAQNNQNNNSNLNNNNNNNNESYIEKEGIKYKEIERREGLTIEEFTNEYIKKGKPVILTNEMNDWPALKKWNNFNYLKQCAGNRTIPIEIGSSYLNSDWSQSLMTLSQFIDSFILTNNNNNINNNTNCNDNNDNNNGGDEKRERENKKKGYLAQVRMFDFIPKLRKDIATPIFCSICDIGNENDLVINAWFVRLFIF